MKKYVRAFGLLVESKMCLCLLFIAATAFSANAEVSYRFNRSWPTLQQPWYFSAPRANAVDTGGFVYVADTYNNCVKKFSSTGQWLATWGIKGSGPGEFNNPAGIAACDMGYIYVADTGNNRIQKFTEDGRFLMEWGGFGSDEGQFSSPWGLALDSTGQVYVADSGNDRIQKFSDNGVFLMTWGHSGTGQGDFQSVRGLAIDQDGYVYAVDQSNDRIQKFTSDGAYVTHWTDPQLTNPFYIAVDGDGGVYVSNALNGCSIIHYDADGTFISEWGNCGSGSGQMDWPQGIAVSPNGSVYLSDYGNDRIQLFTKSGQFLSSWASAGIAEGFFLEPRGIEVDSNGNIYVVDSGNNRIQKFSEDGIFLMSWGGAGSENGQFAFYWNGYNYGGDIAVNSTGDVFVVDTKNYRIQRFSSNGDYVTKWGEPGENPGQFGLPIGIAIDSLGIVYVADASNRILKFTINGDYLGEWGSSGTGDGQFSSIFDVAVDSNGDVYVSDGSDRIQKFTPDGTFIEKWGESGKGLGQLDGPWAIAVSNVGDIYVADRHNSRVQVFSQDGSATQQFGEHGSNPGQFGLISDIAIDLDGNIYAAEDGNHRVQIFKPTTAITNAKAVLVAGGGPFAGNHLWGATQMNANFAYRAFVYQGFHKEGIYYLTSDTDLDLDDNGIADDVDGDATNTNLEQAITSWATDADSLVLYLVDHGGDGTFRMSGTETLSMSDLNQWITALQAATGCQVTFIYDACESGSVLSTLSAENRTVITSTSEGEPAYFLTQGSISFSSYFWTHVFNGLDIQTAFDLASQAMGTPTDFQQPLIDADGDGTGNEQEDFDLTSGVYIGNGTLIHGDGPVIGSVSSTQTISETATATLEALGVSDGDGIARVWAVLRPPDYNQGDSDNPINALPSVDLLPVDGSPGEYRADYDLFAQAGTWQIAIYARDRLGNTSVPSLTSVAVENPLRRKAVVVAAGSVSDALWPAVETNARKACEALSAQGYGTEDIYLISPASIPGVPLLPVLPDLSNLEFALTDWAATSSLDLTVYLVGTGSSAGLKLNGTEWLTAGVLDDFLDTLQATLPGIVTVVYDACQSGGFVGPLVPPAEKLRIVLASTGADQAASFLNQGQISFSHYFWNQVANGASVYDAYILGKNAVRFQTSAAGMITAQIDDTANGVSNEKADGVLSRRHSIGTGIMLAGDDPVIGQVPGEQTLSRDKSATLWAAGVTSSGIIEKVLAVVTPPSGAPGTPDTPITSMITVPLSYNAGNARWEAEYDGFTASGAYEIAFYAEDDEGNLSQPASTRVIQNVATDTYEDDDTQQAAKVVFINDIQSQQHNFDAGEDKDWVKFYAVAGGTFTVEAHCEACDVDFTIVRDGMPDVVVQNYGAGVTESYDVGGPDSPAGIVYVKCYLYTAYGNDPVGPDQTGYSFKVYQPTAPTTAEFGGVVNSAYTGSAIGDAILVSSSGTFDTSALTESIGGDYQIYLAEGSSVLEVSAAGYDTYQQMIDVSASDLNNTVLLDINLIPNADLSYAIAGLQLLSGMTPAIPVAYTGDINNDDQFGMAEVIHILERLAGVRN